MGKRVQRGRFAARIQGRQKVQRVQRGRYRPAGDEYEVSVTRLPSCPAVILSASEESRYMAPLRQKVVNTGRREGGRNKKAVKEWSTIFHRFFNRHYSSFSISGAIASGVLVGSKRAATFPSLSMRNLVKFHLMESSSRKWG